MMKIFGILTKSQRHLALILLSVLALSSCDKDNANIGVDPYEGGREPFGISFLNNFPEPEIARPNELVTFAIKGLKPFEGKVKFFINETETQIISIADSSIVVRLPEQISSGTALVQVEQQIFTGPILYVEGRVSVDQNYRMVNGFNGTVNTIFPLSNGFFVGGFFTNFEDQAIANQAFRNGIHFIDNNGQSTSTYNFGRGAVNIRSIARLANGKYIVAGSFNEFNRKATNSITMLYANNGQLDTTVVDVINTTPTIARNGKDTVATFNGGVLGSILRVFTLGNQVIAVGNFTHYYKVDYSFSSREQRASRITRANDIIKMNTDGSLDSTYQYNHSGFNGQITDAIMQTDGKIVVVGSFNQYNGQQVRNIVRLNTDGSIDPSFLIGSGTDLGIERVTYHAPSNRIVIAGLFRSVNGQQVNGLAILKSDGTLDTSFKLGDIGTGDVLYGKILSNGKVFVNGIFKYYNGIARSNMLILEPSGQALQEYNNIGAFYGNVNDVQETTSTLGRPALLIGGSFGTVDGKRVGNVVRLEVR